MAGVLMYMSLTMSFCKVWRMRRPECLPGSLSPTLPPPHPLLKESLGTRLVAMICEGNSIIIDRLKFTSNIFYRRKYADPRYNQTPVPQEQEEL